MEALHAKDLILFLAEGVDTLWLASGQPQQILIL